MTAVANNRYNKRGREFLKLRRLQTTYHIMRALMFPIFAIGFGIRYILPGYQGLALEWLMMLGMPIATVILLIVVRAQTRKARNTPPFPSHRNSLRGPD